jgi:hypothetical protein
MKTETTYTIEQIAEKINQYKKTLCDNKNHEWYCTDLQLNTEIFENFIKWVEPKLTALGWIGYDKYNNCYFEINPTQDCKKRYSMREVMFKPEDTE